MTFPVVHNADTTHGVQASNSTSWTGTYPANIAAGDLLLLFLANDGTASATVNAPETGWNAMGRGNSGANALNCLTKIAAGGESGNFVITLSSSEQGAWRIFRITGWYGSGIPVGDGNLNGNGASEVQTIIGSPSNAPDPEVLNPANWDVEDTLWIAAVSVDTSRAITGYPSNMPDINASEASGGSTGATLGVAMLSSAAASLNPNAFACTSDDWITMTVAIRPAPSASDALDGRRARRRRTVYR